MDDRKRIKKRIGRLRCLLAEKHLDALAVVSAANVRYLTGFTGDDSWAVVSARRVILLTDSRYGEQAAGECRCCRIVERRGPIAAALAGLVGGCQTIGIEDVCSVAVFKAVRKALSAKVRAVGGIVESLRAVKDTVEIAGIKAASAVAWRALRKTLRGLNAGLTETELAARLDYNIRSLGVETGFDTIVAFGPNGSRNHHCPGKRRLRCNDTILVDFGAKVDGYTCDITRCFVFGRSSAEYRDTYSAVAAAQKAAISVIRPGALIVDADAAARKTLVDKGLAVYGHGTGHGIGLEVHERPAVSQAGKKGRFESGQTVTVEPGVYIPGRFGIRIEDDVLVAAGGCRILTRHKLWFDPEIMPVLPGC